MPEPQKHASDCVLSFRQASWHHMKLSLRTCQHKSCTLSTPGFTICPYAVNPKPNTLQYPKLLMHAAQLLRWLSCSSIHIYDNSCT